MIGEILLNIAQLKDNRFKIETDKYTYIYITLDMYNNATPIKSLPDIIYIGEIKAINDDGVEFIIVTESGKNTIELKTYSCDFGHFMLVDKFQ